MSDSAIVITPVAEPEAAPPKRAPRREWRLLGPHFFFDLIRLARGKRVRDLRMLYTFGMLVALLLLYMARFRWVSWFELFFGESQSMSINDRGYFAESFVFSILFVQNMAVFLLTPIYLGSCITEEKERRSLELLFISPLRNHEILFGKLFARMMHLGGILLAGLPILSLAQLWGGVDMTTLVLNFINTFFNLVSVGCFSLMISVLMKRTLNAVMLIYGVMLLPLLILALFARHGAPTPFGFLQFHTATAVALAMLFVLHTIVATISILMAHVFLRRNAELPPRWQEPPRRAPRVRQNAPERTIRRVRDFAVPPVNDTPLLWKEYFFGPRPHSHLLFWLLSTIFLFSPMGLGGVFLLLASGLRGIRGDGELNFFGGMCRLFAVLCALLYILWSSFRAAGSLVRERQHKTLDELLTLPIDRTVILGYKWLGSALHGWIFAAYFMAIVFLGTVTTGLHLAAGIFLLGSVLVHAVFWTTLGLYFSVICRTVLSAYMRLGLAFLFVIVATFMYAAIVNFGRDDWTGSFLSWGLNPLATWWVLAFTSRDYRNFDMEPGAVVGCLAGVLIYALLTLSVGLLTYGKFQRERYRHVE